jgi:REP element-mobilizing transposase RayT
MLILQMSVQQTIPYKDGIFFITFTCYKWMPLLQVSDSYDLVYKWFDYLKVQGHKINGYVIMPNHVHSLISFKETSQSINTVIGNDKRFIAYDILKRLRAKDEKNILATLAKDIEAKRKANNKQHNIWELSFDWKYCDSITFIKQKLNYIHDNPCKGKWNLCNRPIDYVHSSAKHYIEGTDGIYKIDDIG